MSEKSGLLNLRPWRMAAAVAGAGALTMTLAACGSSGDDAAAAGTSTSGSTASAADCTGKFSLRLSSDVPDTSAAGIADALFAKKVSEYTGGKVTVKVYPLSQLGAEATVLTGIQTGSIDFADLYTGSVVGQLPTLGLYSLPFLVRSDEGANALYNSDVTKTVLESLSSKKVHGLYVANNGPFEVLAKKAINSPSDFDGLKLRINTDPISTAMLKQVGATAVALPSLEVYSALQQGLVSGGITAPAGMVSLKWFEQAKVLSELGPQWDAQVMVASPTTWKRLPAGCQTAITQAVADTMKDNATTAVTATQANLDLLKKAGVTFVNPDKTAFRETESKIYSQFSSSIGQSTIDAATALESKY